MWVKEIKFLTQGLHRTITVWFFAICASSFVDFLSVRFDHFVGNPAEVRNCLTVDALMPKFTFSGRDPIALATFSLFSCAITTPTMFSFSLNIGPTDFLALL